MDVHCGSFCESPGEQLGGWWSGWLWAENQGQVEWAPLITAIMGGHEVLDTFSYSFIIVSEF